MSLNRYKLILEEGPTPGQEYFLNRPEMVLGRDPNVELVIQSPAISRRHIRLVRDGNTYTIEDLGSSNGTYINGTRIESVVRLKAGDQIKLGKGIGLTYHAPAQVGDGGRTAAQSFTSKNEQDVTIIEAAIRLEDLAPASQMVITVAGAQPQLFTLTKDTITIGRAEDNDIVIPSKIVSRHHARLERQDGGYRLTNLPDASNPLLYEGRPFGNPLQLHHGDILRIDSLDPGLMVTLAYNNPQEASQPKANQIQIGEKTRIQIGRDPGNDVVLNTPSVSRFHAQVERIGQRYRLVDLRSSNGTFVNDERIEGEVWLQPQDTVRIGSYRFIVGKDRISQYDETGGVRVESLRLNKWVRKDLNLLKDLSLVFQPREFIVVVGQSGGGKSTLVDAISGYRPATHGRVLVNGIDAYRNFDAIRNDIGYVPQRDIIHTELTVFQALDYSAQLRMPPDTTVTERHKRVMDVLDDLDLAHRKDVQISGLSGGQQKRVSIGVELLTKPGLFFLDEPTSGLDPGTETALMQLMRRLADQGRTIVLVTHATKNVMLADKVVFLARGGYLAWFGPPDEALKFFDKYRSERDQRASSMEFDQIYAILDDSSKGTPEEWAKRFNADPAYHKYIVAPLEAVPSQPARPAAARTLPGGAPRRQVSSLRQFIILSSRNIKILTRDRFSLFLMLASAPLVGLLDVLVSLMMSSVPFDFVEGSMQQVMLTLFLLTMYGVMVGGIAQMREIVKESEIYRRERLVNLKILPYILSKVWVAALLALYQAIAYTVIHYLAFDMPGGPLEFGLVYITLVLATLAGMMLGLFASALAPNANAAPLIVILLVLPQIVLSGALIPLPSVVSMPTSTRWAFEALMSITGGGSDVAADLCWTLPEDVHRAMSIEDKQAAGCLCMGTSALKEETCAFPGLGKFYNTAIDEVIPAQPEPLGDPPPEPELPARPVEPADQSDTIAMTEFFNDLREWERQVTAIQAQAKADLEAFQARAEVFKAESIAFQEKLARWHLSRAAAVEPAEGVIGQFHKDIGWTFVDKNNPVAYWSKIFFSWFAQLAIILILFTGILFLQKRKDVI